MNTSKVQQIINQLIEEKQIHYARQYPVAKHQLAKLEELGILNLMPAKFGHTDAAVVIEAATASKSAVMNAYGEGEETAASDLYAALHEVEEVAIVETVSTPIDGFDISGLNVFYDESDRSKAERILNQITETEDYQQKMERCARFFEGMAERAQHANDGLSAMSYMAYAKWYWKQENNVAWGK